MSTNHDQDKLIEMAEGLGMKELVKIIEDLDDRLSQEIKVNEELSKEKEELEKDNKKLECQNTDLEDEIGTLEDKIKALEERLEKEE